VNPRPGGTSVNPTPSVVVYRNSISASAPEGAPD